MSVIKRTLTLILALAALCSFCLAEETLELEEVTGPAVGASAEGEAVIEKDGWHFDAKGFLTGEDNPGEEYILEDEKNGFWQYASRDLAVTVTRYREKVKKKTREYCIAEIHASAASPLSSITSDATKKRPIGYMKENPTKLAQKYNAVFAISDDYYGHRMQTRDQGKASWPVGVIIRDSGVLNAKTRPTGNRTWPPLDTMSVYEDGSLKVQTAGEKTAEEFLEEGAIHVFAFGPWLIRDGVVNEEEAGENSNYYHYIEPRTAIGMVEPFHYIAIVVKGEPADKYTGAYLSWLTAKFLEYGCTDAFNLDGGGTACMVFNGKAIEFGRSKVRNMGSMIAFGLRKKAGE